jgi:hypothetical protein
MFIPDPDFSPSLNPDPGYRGPKIPGSGSATLYFTVLIVKGQMQKVIRHGYIFLETLES